jgi:hypothetical protein
MDNNCSNKRVSAFFAIFAVRPISNNLSKVFLSVATLER